MIVRMWHGRTKTTRAADYLRFLHERAIPDYRRIPGNLAVYLLHREEGDVTHFITLTHWESMAAIAAFAGDDVERAKYYPEDADFLLEYEPAVVHYTVGGSAP
jgi:heme-degrading monooxygenase HmoA